MIPVDQTTFGGPNDAPPGNCTSACVASLLEIPVAEVPTFILEPDWWGAMRRFLRTRGFTAVYVRGDPFSAGKGNQACFAGRGPDQKSVGWMAPTETLCIAGGDGPRGHGHSVVWRLGVGMVHDPHPSRAGLVGEPDDYIILIPITGVNA